MYFNACSKSSTGNAVHITPIPMIFIILSWLDGINKLLSTIVHIKLVSAEPKDNKNVADTRRFYLLLLYTIYIA